MHEWGLGLKQDFPLAKRHYDLAATTKSGEAEMAVQIALAAMGVHERLVRARLAWDEWLEGRESGATKKRSAPRANSGRSRPLWTGNQMLDILLGQFLSWDMALVLLLVTVLTLLIQMRLDRGRRQ